MKKNGLKEQRDSTFNDNGIVIISGNEWNNTDCTGSGKHIPESANWTEVDGLKGFSLSDTSTTVGKIISRL